MSPLFPRTVLTLGHITKPCAVIGQLIRRSRKWPSWIRILKFKGGWLFAKRVLYCAVWRSVISSVGHTETFSSLDNCCEGNLWTQIIVYLRLGDIQTINYLTDMLGNKDIILFTFQRFILNVRKTSQRCLERVWRMQKRWLDDLRRCLWVSFGVLVQNQTKPDFF